MEQLVAYLVAIVTLVSAIIGLFSKYLVTPLNSSIQGLSSSIDKITEDTKKEFKDVDNKIESVEKVFDAKIELQQQRISEIDKQNIINTQSLKSLHHRFDDMKGDKK